MKIKRIKLLALIVLVHFSLVLLAACFPRESSEIPRGWSATGVPTPEPMQINMRVVAVYATGRGFAGTHAITEDGQLWSWGGHAQDSDFRPVRNTEFEEVIAISNSGRHRMIIASDGTLWGRGSNEHGQVGVGRIGRPPSVISETIIMEDVIAVSTGHSHTMAITSDNVLWGWGRNTWGELGDETAEDRLSPVKIMEDVIAVSAGFGQTVAITSDNVLWGWGRRMGRSDDGTSEDSFIPIRLMENVMSASVDPLWIITSDNVLRYSIGGDPIKEDVIAVSGGTNHTMAITSDGSLWAWGRNRAGLNAGMLGNGTFRDSPEPIKIMENVVAVSASHAHTLAITSDGSLWAWGDNSSSQLGIGTDRGEYEERPLRGVFPKAWLSPVLVMEYVPEGS